MEHAGGPEKLDRTPFEMAAKGEGGCRLVADPALHEKLRTAMIGHLERNRRVPRIWTWWILGSPSDFVSCRRYFGMPLTRTGGVFLGGIEGFPVGVKNPLPRTRDVFEPQTKWKLEMGPLDVAQSWKANYESAEENLSFVREHFDTEVAEAEALEVRKKEGFRAGFRV